MLTVDELVHSRCTRPVAIGDGHGDYMTLNCSSRDASQCPHCAALYKNDWFQLILSGLVHDIEAPKPASGYRPLLTDVYDFFFLTLTAPSFGRTHHVPKKGRPPVHCGCGQVHTADDHQFRGLPLDADSYDYLGQVRFNFDLGDLWNSTRTGLVQKLPEMAFLKVVELQARGAGHLHIVIRLPKHYRVSPAEILRIAQAQHAWGELSDCLIGWGKQGDCQKIGNDPKDAARQAGYLIKLAGYSTKSLTTKLIREGLDFRPYRDHVARLHATAHEVICPSCVLVAGEYRCCSRKHNAWGLGQQPLSMSRPRTNLDLGYIPGWSLPSWTRTSLKNRRQEYAAARAGGAEPAHKPASLQTRQLLAEANRLWRLGEGFNQDNLIAMRQNYPLKPDFDAVADQIQSLLPPPVGKPFGSKRPQASERTSGVALQRSAGTARSLDSVKQTSKFPGSSGSPPGGLSPGLSGKNRRFRARFEVDEGMLALVVSGLTR